MESPKESTTSPELDSSDGLSTSLSSSEADLEKAAQQKKWLAEVADRIVRVRGKRTQKEFGDALGIHVNSIGRYERADREPGNEFILAMGSVEGIDPYWLLFGKGEMYLDGPRGPGLETAHHGSRNPFALDGGRRLIAQHSSADEARLPLGFVLIPRFDVKAAAGRGAINDSEDLLGHYAYDEGWIRRELKVEPSRICIISVIGDSMDPLIFEGDEVMVDRAVTRFIGDSIYLVRFEGGLLIKQLQRSPGGIIRVVSRNPSYREQTVNERADQFGVDFAILGRVLGKPTFVKF